MVSVTAVLDRRADITSMWVAPQARGRGVGEALLRAALAQAAAGGATRAVLAVKSDNERAVHLYRRSGFVDVGAAHAHAVQDGERRMEADLVDFGCG